MNYSNIIEFNKLNSSDLIIDAIYEGGNSKNAGDDPINKLIGCGVQGGFRIIGSSSKWNIKLCVLYSDLSDPDWPDRLDFETGTFIYYGDNKRPGKELHNTPKRGNFILKCCFDELHKGNNFKIPPFLIFTKGGKGRDVIFRGVAVPGAIDISSVEDLVAIWKTSENQRFQNYKALFTILDIRCIKREWLNDIKSGNILSKNAPEVWIQWANNKKYIPLRAPKTLKYRTKKEQLPDKDDKNNTEIVDCIINFFKNHKDREYAFEKCAVKIVQMMDRNINECDLTRPWRDGGRDAVGKYKIGMDSNEIFVDFALEAKCKNMKNGSGVKETSRLISRLRYRQFGIFVTTSFVSKQAYEEIEEDGHPVIIISGKDIARILIETGYRNKNEVREWLINNFL